MLTLDYLKDLINCNTKKGVLTWKVSRGKVKAGTVAGYISSSDGYRYIRIDLKRYGAHRLVWFFAHGYLPELEIDHKNNNRADNRIENLREATRSQNSYNTLKQSNNKSGYKGVYFYKRVKKYYAQICVEGNRVHLGTFDTPEEASKAYIKASKMLHKEFSKF